MCTQPLAIKVLFDASNATITTIEHCIDITYNAPNHFFDIITKTNTSCENIFFATCQKGPQHEVNVRDRAGKNITNGIKSNNFSSSVIQHRPNNYL